MCELKAATFDQLRAERKSYVSRLCQMLEQPEHSFEASAYLSAIENVNKAMMNLANLELGSGHS